MIAIIKLTVLFICDKVGFMLETPHGPSHPEPPLDIPPELPPTPPKKPNLIRRMMTHRATPWVTAAALVITLEGISQEKDNARFDALKEQTSQNDRQLRQQLDRVAKIAGQAARVDTDTMLGIGLAPVEQLSGYGEIVSLDQRATVRDSSVSLLFRPKASDDNPPQEWRTYCSGNIVDVGGRRVVATAASCFQDKSRIQTPTQEGVTTAYDIGQMATFEYAVMPSTWEPMPHSYRPDETLLGSVRNIAVIPSGRTALLGIDTTSRPVLSKGSAALFDAMPAIRAQRQDPAEHGQQVALAPRLESKDNSRREAVGTLLGVLELRDKNTPADIFYAVGLQASPPQHDSCGLGAIGVLADGSFAGPAYDRINPSNASTDVPRMLQIEDALKIDTSRFAATCRFDKPSMEELSQLITAFNRPPAPELIAPAS